MATTLDPLTESIVSPLQALGDRNRLRILDALRDGERCVCRLTEGLAMDQPLLSHHLRVLRDAGLVSGRKEGRWVYYSIVPEGLREIEAFLATLENDASTAGPGYDRC